MRLRNKKTGEIIETDAELSIKEPTSPTFGCPSYDIIASYNSLAELAKEWEDAPEEPKGKHWYMTSWGEVWQYGDDPLHEEWRRTLGNDFETEEEAKKAVEKLKVWKRLKDSGVRFVDWCYAVDGNRENGAIPIIIKAECRKDTSLDDLDLLFGGDA